MVALLRLEIVSTHHLLEERRDLHHLEEKEVLLLEVEMYLQTEEVMQTQGKMTLIEEMMREDIEEVKGIVVPGEEMMIQAAKGIMIGKIEYVSFYC